jgi:hypothetical protein
MDDHFLSMHEGDFIYWHKKGFVCFPGKRNGKMIIRPELNHSELLAFSFPP